MFEVNMTVRENMLLAVLPYFDDEQNRIKWVQKRENILYSNEIF
jgi:hypothetical protein